MAAPLAEANACYVMNKENGSDQGEGLYMNGRVDQGYKYNLNLQDHNDIEPMSEAGSPVDLDQQIISNAKY